MPFSLQVAAFSGRQSEVGKSLRLWVVPIITLSISSLPCPYFILYFFYWYRLKVKVSFHSLLSSVLQSCKDVFIRNVSHAGDPGGALNGFQFWVPVLMRPPSRALVCELQLQMNNSPSGPGQHPSVTVSQWGNSPWLDQLTEQRHPLEGPAQLSGTKLTLGPVILFPLLPVIPQPLISFSLSYFNPGLHGEINCQQAHKFLCANVLGTFWPSHVAESTTVSNILHLFSLILIISNQTPLCHIWPPEKSFITSLAAKGPFWPMK